MRMQKQLIRVLMLLITTVVAGSACTTMNARERVNNATAHYQLGVSHLNEDNIQPAFVEFQKALELNPNDKEVLNAIGIIYLFKLEDYVKAIEYFQKALVVDKNYSEAVNNLGLAFEKTGRFEDAIEAYKNALSNQLYRSAEKTFNNLGRVYYRAGKYESSLDAFRQAVKRFPDFHLPYYGMALCYNAIKKYDDAAVALKKAIEIDPAYKGNREQAIKDMNERKVIAGPEEKKDLSELLEIMNY